VERICPVSTLKLKRILVKVFEAADGEDTAAVVA
jgi:hypothetical protein